MTEGRAGADNVTAAAGGGEDLQEVKDEPGCGHLGDSGGLSAAAE